MNITATLLRERLTAADFAAIEEISPSVLRFNRRMAKADSSYAVCYLDFSNELPTTRESLLNYQDQLIGQRYFEGPKSLQWNTYLYFITSAEQLASVSGQQTKELIERDRTYARKLVLAEEDVETLFTPLGLDAVTSAMPAIDVLSLWTNKLAEAGLYEAVFDFGDNQIPARLNRIELAPLPTADRLTLPKLKQQAPEAQFLKSLRLDDYRPHPTQQEFEFGKVNLIVGANGAGKTSLLEAIELFYCGTHNREEDKPLTYKLSATWADGKVESADQKRRPQVFRDHNLAWYGQPEVKTNNLFQSFGRFNFLNTDAAVSLATSTERMEDDLSKLLIGAEASKTWRVIQDLHQAVSGRVRELQTEMDQLKEQLALLVAPVTERVDIPQTSTGLYARLQALTTQLQWQIASPQALTTNHLSAELAELISLLKQVIALKWLVAPVSAGELTRFRDDAQTILQKVEPALDKWQNAVLPAQKRLAGQLNREKQVLLLAQQVQQHLSAGILSSTHEHTQHDALLSKYTAWLTDCTPATLNLLAEANHELTVAEHLPLLSIQATIAREEAANAQKEYDRFSALREQSLNLAQQLRQLATKILQHSPTPDECPLCHTEFIPGDLTKRMAIGVDAQVEVLAQSLLSLVQSKADEVQAATAAENAVTWLSNFCEQAELPKTVSVQHALQQVVATQHKVIESQNAIKKIGKKIDSLLTQGITFAGLQKVANQLRVLHPTFELSDSAVETLVKVTEEGIAKTKAEIAANEDIERRLFVLISQQLGQVNDIGAYASLVAEKKEQIAVTDSLQEKLMTFLQSFPWPEQVPISKLLVEVELFLQLVIDWQNLHRQEEEVRLATIKTNKHKELLTVKIEQVNPRLLRFSEAQVVLEDLLKNHSLTAATETALQENRAGIESIFTRIHAPNEFGVLKDSDNTSKSIKLVRKSTNTPVKLNQISTGQRAAFALSVFLAQNARLKATAPPVMLIDDPIAHIDDLNALTFIDYLREVVIASKRQLFFATSDEKLASLIERKFDFLGEKDFKRFNLYR